MNEATPACLQTFSDRILFMCLLNDIEWRNPESEPKCLQNSHDASTFSAHFPQGIWCPSGPGPDKCWQFDRLADENKTRRDVGQYRREDNNKI